MPKHKLKPKHLRHKYTNLFFVGVSIILTLVLSQTPLFHLFVARLENYGYAGAFLAGLLWVSTFTVAPGTLLLIALGQHLPIVPLGIYATIGAIVGDMTIFHIVKNNLLGEIQELSNHFGGKHLRHLLHSRYFRWTLPVIGALIIASPLPDDLGVTLLGISKMQTIQFVIISFFLNAVGIYSIIGVSLLA